MVVEKVFEVEELDCIHCAAKMEEAIRRIEGVEYVSLVYMTQKLYIKAEEDIFDEVMKKAQKVCRKIEPDCRIVM